MRDPYKQPNKINKQQQVNNPPVYLYYTILRYDQKQDV